MTGIGLIIVFILAIALMIFCISKLKIHPFLAIMAISLVFGLIAGIPLVNTTDADGNTVQPTEEESAAALQKAKHRHRDHLRRSGRYAA